MGILYTKTLSHPPPPPSTISKNITSTSSSQFVRFLSRKIGKKFKSGNFDIDKIFNEKQNWNYGNENSIRANLFPFHIHQSLVYEDLVKKKTGKGISC